MLKSCTTTHYERNCLVVFHQVHHTAKVLNKVVCNVEVGIQRFAMYSTHCFILISNCILAREHLLNPVGVLEVHNSSNCMKETSHLA